MIYQWAVIGAGPAGIAAVGKLLDTGIDQKSILWIDPNFTVGDFGTLWRNVPGNTKVKTFIDFLNASPAFAYSSIADRFELSKLDPEQSCKLAFTDNYRHFKN
jgi:cation diffusion facilitator CzcD-associated flavoprotein CzcO